ncbi:hypothetical protein CPC16_009562 [Podila verticillata]|nr:hypothetical protein CPC16_009562 [Podila verticillata]
MSAQEDSTLDLVLLVKRQVLQMRQLRQFQWTLPGSDAPSVTSPEVQQAILDHIFYDPVVMKHPPSPLYQHSFLKKLIAMIENEGIHEISDDLLEFFTDLMMTVPMSFWLAEYFIAHPDLLSGKNVIDIGCGVGFLGISCAMLDAKKVVLTDGNTDVLTMAKENIGYNSVACPTTASLLDWENFTEEQIVALDAEVLILSDLTYDPTNIVPLITVLKAILVKGVSAYMSSAIRNPKTFVDFFARIKEECHGVEIQEIPLDDVEHLFFFDEDSVQTVKVFHLFFPQS